MNSKQVANLLKFKTKQAEQQRRRAKAVSMCAPGTDPALAMEILKAQERAAQREAKRTANEARIRGTK